MPIRASLLSLKGLFRGLREEDLHADPIRQFEGWYKTARRGGLYLPNAFSLATTGPEGRPSTRMMLLKGFDERGFVFFTNYESRKGHELEGNPFAAMVFHWNALMRQVRLEGEVQRTSQEESLAYFNSRARGSRIGAWASPQSSTMGNRAELETMVRETAARYRGDDIPLPPHWGGFRLIPDRIEFWQGRPDRLHDRLCYVRDGDGWKISRLAP